MSLNFCSAVCRPDCGPVKLHRELAIGPLQLLGVGRLRARQDFVKVLLRHCRAHARRDQRWSAVPGRSPGNGRHLRLRHYAEPRFFVVDFLEIGVDDVVVRRSAPPCAAMRAAVLAAAGRPPASCCALYIASPSFIATCPRASVFALICSTSSPAELSFSAWIALCTASRVAGRHLVAGLGRLRSVVWISAVGLVPRLDQLAPLLVFGRMRLGILDHLVDVAFRTARPRPGCGSAAPCRSPCPWRRR